ncbi:hypothetical protein BC835DRAFT_1413788 [Cytidiella melzeri]|nr:hypothetical protein BC835DRAFT_1413788 [Cytidiella melzeri]
MADKQVAFTRGIASFKAGQYKEALRYFNEAIRLAPDDPLVYDSRAAAYEKLGRTNKALYDAQKVITLNPSRWQGYARSARLFKDIRKYRTALSMVDHAIQRLKSNEGKRREFETLRMAIVGDLARKAEEERQLAKKTFQHFGSLPIEIAATIFHLLHEDDHAAVVVLAQICQGWRRIVTSTPALWRTLSLSDKKPVEKAKLWKLRSRGILKELHLRGGKEVLWALEILNDISLYSLRCLTVTACNWKDITSALPQLTPSIMSNLETVELGEQDTHRWFHNTSKLRLRRLIANATPVDWTNLAECSGQITELSHAAISEQDVPDLLRLLHRNANLQALELWFVSRLRRRDEPERPLPEELPSQIELSWLTTLSLVGYINASAGQILPRLVLPNLRSLKLERSGNTLDRSLRRLLESKSVSRLESLVINTGHILDQEMLVQLLNAATELNAIHLRWISGLDAVIEALAGVDSATRETNGAGLICPKLTSVDFSRCPDVRDGPIVRLVKARSRSSVLALPEDQSPTIAKLESLAIDGCEKIDPSILPWLRQQVPHVSCKYATKKQAHWKR